MQVSDYVISEVTDLASFGELTRVVWTAYHQPYKPYFNAYNPVLGVTRADREEAIIYSINTQWAAHQQEPSSRWICVRERVDGEKETSREPEKDAYEAGASGTGNSDDRATLGRSIDESRLEHNSGDNDAVSNNDSTSPKLGRIVAGCQWKFFERNPNSDASDDHLTYDAGRWPEGSAGREFVMLMLKKHFGHQRRWLRRPHAITYMMSVLPTHRRRGLASMITARGTRQAAALRLEVFMHASDDSRWVYERHGLRVIEKLELHTSTRR